MNINRKHYSPFSFAGTFGGDSVRGSDDGRRKKNFAVDSEVIGIYKISSNNRNADIASGPDNNHQFEQIAGLLKSGIHSSEYRQQYIN